MNRPLYNQLVPYYEFVEGRNWNDEVGLINSVLRKHKSKSVVDLGCGTGYHVRALTKLGFNVTGVDISKQNIRFARRRARAENVHPRFVIGSYYHYRPDQEVDAALCLNWSIPVRDREVKRFLDNAHAMLGPGGLLLLDFERISQIVWKDVGKPIVESWDRERELIVRVSVGQIRSNVLASRDLYAIYPKNKGPMIPDETLRYETARGKGQVRVYLDCSYVRFFSMHEIRRLAAQSGFTIAANYMLPRNTYRRNYVALKKTA
jgi:SAM-dependent methyltransferase